MADLQWYYPATVQEAVALIRRTGVVPHAGGTGLLMTGLRRLQGLVDLGRLGLDRVEAAGDRVTLGAACTYAAAARELGARQPGHVLAQAVGEAASTPLRNRITLGGSLAFAPAWSDLVGPLVALDAEVLLAGEAEGVHPVERYLRERGLREGSLVTGIRFRDGQWGGVHFRQTRTRTDRPAFTLTVLARQPGPAGGTVDCRIVVAGCSGRFHRATECEEIVSKHEPAAVPLGEAAGRLEARFQPRLGFSADYLTHCARVALERSLAAVLGREG